MQSPRKSLGQHWLSDLDILRYIVDLAEIEPDDVILEIGSGPGSLTEVLLQNSKQVFAIELDSNLAHELNNRISSPKLKVVEADILKFNLSDLPTGYKVVANIPYYLTSKLLRVLSEAANPPKIIVLLVQKEVAQRVAAQPGSMGILSVSVQLYYQPSLGRVVQAEKFVPPPKVDSQVVKLVRRPKPMFKDLDEKEFFRVVRAGFSEKRKKLRSSLSGGLGLNKQEADMLLNQADINGDLRAEVLSLDQWHRLYIEFLARKNLHNLLPKN